MTPRFCPFAGREVTPLREASETHNGMVYTWWHCPAHDADDRTPDDAGFDAQWPQVHASIDGQSETAGAVNADRF